MFSTFYLNELEGVHPQRDNFVSCIHEEASSIDMTACEN